MRARATALFLFPLAVACSASDGLEEQASACADASALALPGAEPYLVALNAYYLQEEAARAIRRGDPEAWGVWPALAAPFGASFLDRRMAVARALGKPMVLGEFGLRNDGLPLEDRRAIYRGWLACVRRGGGAGVAPWLFAYDARPDEWDPHTFYWRDATDAADPVNRYADVVREAAAGTR
jgi:hypothetical protein